MIAYQMPRYTSYVDLASGRRSFYWTCPTADRKKGCPYRSVTLGTDLTPAQLLSEAAVWNERLDGWRQERLRGPVADDSRYGTVDWLVGAYQKHSSFLERVAEFSRPDYRRVLDRVCDTTIKGERGTKARVGSLRVNQIGVGAAERIYDAFVQEGAARTAEKVVTYCKAMWKRMHPHHPKAFRTDIPNPWEGVTLKRRQKSTKAHADRATTYTFARGAIAHGEPALAAAAVLAFEWFLRPSNIGAGWAVWTGYRSAVQPDKIAIRHRKNGQAALHPLEYEDNGVMVPLYAEAEAILSQVPRHGLSIVAKPNGTLYGDGTLLSQKVREIADKLELYDFTLDAARHGGMTELEEAGLTEGQGRALSQHRTSAAYRGYAKETELRMLNATKKRFGHSEQAEKPLEIKGGKIAKKADF